MQGQMHGGFRREGEGATKDASIMLDLIPPGNILLSTTAGIRIMAHHDDTDTTYAERSERRAQLAPSAPAGVTEAIMHAVVHAFYELGRGGCRERGCQYV